MPVARAWMRKLSWQTALLALVCGGIIHIAATLIVPNFASGSGIARIAGALPVNRMRVLPPATAETQLLPFTSPDMRLAVCRYDVSDGPVNISAVLPEKGWSLSLYTMNGDNFYIVPAQELVQSDVKFQLVLQSERFLGLFHVGRPIEAAGSQIAVPQPQGLMVVRAPLRGRAYQSETEAYLQRARCGTQRVG